MNATVNVFDHVVNEGMNEARFQATIGAQRVGIEGRAFLHVREQNRSEGAFLVVWNNLSANLRGLTAHRHTEYDRLIRRRAVALNAARPIAVPRQFRFAADEGFIRLYFARKRLLMDLFFMARRIR